MSDFTRLFDKLDSLDERLNNIDITLAKQETSLAEHIRRTNLLEEKLEPVEKHVTMLNGVAKFIGLSALLAGIYSVFKK